MAIDLKKWRLRHARSSRTSGAIGEPDAHVFNCPKCARPLTEGTPRCPGCGVRLIMGVVLRRAGTLMGFGFVIGLFIGGVVMSAVITTLIHPAAPAVAAEPAATAPRRRRVGAPNASAGPCRRPAVDPGGRPLLAPPDVAPRRADRERRRRPLGCVPVQGLGRGHRPRSFGRSPPTRPSAATSCTQLRTWDEADELAADRAGFYASISAIAHDGLRASMSDKKSYRATAKAMLKRAQGARRPRRRVARPRRRPPRSSFPTSTSGVLAEATARRRV